MKCYVGDFQFDLMMCDSYY